MTSSVFYRDENHTVLASNWFGVIQMVNYKCKSEINVECEKRAAA